jgi:hypothetical protein
MIKIYDERGFIVKESDLRKTYNDLKSSREFDGTFIQYVAECTGKNGTLTMTDEVEEKDRKNGTK